jgi:hypothetical protein
MNRSTTRTALLMICMMGLCHSVKASQCRHVDRLVVVDSNQSIWETSREPVWELSSESTASVRASDCHDEASLNGSVGFHPMIGGKSTPMFKLDREKPIYPRFYNLFVDFIRYSPDPRPPRD